MTISLSATLRRAMGRGFLRSLIALMTFLAFSAAILALACQSMTGRWQADIRHSLTVEIIVTGQAGESTAAAINGFLARLRGLAPVAQASLADAGDLRDMLKPWFGSDATVIERLPLPHLMEIELKNDDAASTQAVQETVDEFVKQQGWQVNIIRHQSWLADIVRFAAVLSAVGWGICLTIAATTGMAVAVAVRAQIVAHADDIEILEILGAPDRYIMRQFLETALWLTAQGVGIGLAASIILWGGLAWLVPDAAQIAQSGSMLPGFIAVTLGIPVLLTGTIATVTMQAVRYALTGGPDRKDTWI